MKVQYHCDKCGTGYNSPVLAKECEDKHNDAYKLINDLTTALVNIMRYQKYKSDIHIVISSDNISIIEKDGVTNSDNIMTINKGLDIQNNELYGNIEFDFIIPQVSIMDRIGVSNYYTGEVEEM